MGRTKKTPPHIIDMLQRHLDQVEWIEEGMDVKQRVPVENQAEHIRSKSVEFMLGKIEGLNSMIEGLNSMIEDALHAYGCYAGYSHRARPTTLPGTTEKFREWVGLADPRFTEYRRVYNVR